jgi:SAM-dependent methyltransferase
VGAREVTAAVARFYDELPFNFQDAERAAAGVRDRNQVAESYPDLDDRLASARTVLDVGCGAGWLSNTCAYHYGVEVRGIDLSRTAVERAREVSELLGVEDATEFRRADLFETALGGRHDVVVSLGVLHHTPDLPGALARLPGWVSERGCVYVGLYHAPSRRPFLACFERYRRLLREGRLTERDAEEAFARYRELDDRTDDSTLARSWFRDQVLHPHETQHTLREVAALLAGHGFAVVSTSINRFAPFERVEDLFELEEAQEEHAQRRLAEGSYLPGFFTVLAERV